MKTIADLHIHSRFSRATSSDISISNLEKWARIKGINLLGTGDFSHPEWLKELKQNLTEDGGILRTKSGFCFVLSTEISNVFFRGKQRKIHNIIIAPDFATVDKINDWLGKKGRLDRDGRPVFEFDCVELVEGLKAIDERIEIIPAHVWTPWYGLFGSKSGFDSIKECFQDQAKHIHTIETGLSSHPPMNWRLSELDDRHIVSFSDAHSYWPWRIGREATIFDIEPNYEKILKALRYGERLVGTIEVDPAYGKYHFDGHRKCGVWFEPKESKRLKGICPVCKKLLTIGVANRVEQLADRPVGFKSKTAKPFFSILPLSEIISAIYGGAPSAQNVWQKYNSLIKKFGNELKILIDVEISEIEKIEPNVAKVIADMRAGRQIIQPGYDGVYGKLILNGKIKSFKVDQKGICDFV
jgi:uncharacterized protein (TIGR00375 family)